MNKAVQNTGTDGTRFRLFPQAPFVDSDNEPETVLVSNPAGSVGPGPADERMYAVFPVNKDDEYGYHEGSNGPFMLLPPWLGSIHSPALPDADGHFDHIPVDSDQFKLAHLFGCTRFVLDVWEGYFGHRIPWHFEDGYDRIELTILPEFQNAQIGYGFLETGSNTTKDGCFGHFCMNFDVVAHEVGHGIIYSQVGTPSPEGQMGEYYGFHESAADLTAIISVLHFDSVLDELLASSSGNLYTLNRLNRFAELSDNEQIRLAANTRTLHEFADGWRREHMLSQPLTGAMFDIFVDIFHEFLVLHRVISPYLENLADQLEYNPEMQSILQINFDKAYAADPQGFKECLILARNTMGSYLAETWRRLSADYLDYVVVAETFIEVDIDFSGGIYQTIILRNVLRRGIGSVTVGPQKEKLNTANSHAHSSRSIRPDNRDESKGQLSFHRRIDLARAAGMRY